MKLKNKEESNCIKTFPKCIEWNLGDIDILGIKNGDFLDEIIFNIAKKICEIASPQDFSALSIQCILDKFNITAPSEKNLQTILKLLIDNDCKLKDLIDNLQAAINNSNIALTLNLKCLAEADEFGSPLPYNTQSILQKLINEVCTQKNNIVILNSKIINLQDQISNLNLNPYTEPLLTSCLFNGVPSSQALTILSNDYCTYKPKVGTITQINTAIGRQCDSIKSLFSSDPNFIQNPLAMAQLVNNLLLVICNHEDRIKSIETTCCAPGCDKIKIGYTYSYDYDTKELTLSFTSGAGTFIPAGFTDCGSSFTFKDCDGNVILTSIQPIVLNGNLVFTLPTGVCLDKVNISIKTKFCLKDKDGNVILTCQDCISKDISIQSECCTLCNNDTENIIVTYTVPTIA